ncbi:hypothetical protein Tco_1530420 [Tanacetum coccineum]
MLILVAALETLSLDESRSPDFDLFSDQEEYSEEEVVETMAETMEQYMIKTQADYGSGVARPKIKDKDNFELKGQFLKELRTNTSNAQILDLRGTIPTKTVADAKVAIQEMVEYSQKWHNGTSRTRSTETSDGLAALQAQLNNLGRVIKKVNEKVYATQVGCEQERSRDDLMPTIKDGEVIEEFRTRDDELDTRIDDYPSCCDYNKKIHIDCAHNLKFSGMIGFEFTHVKFFPLLYVNVMSKKFIFYNRKIEMVYKGISVYMSFNE